MINQIDLFGKNKIEKAIQLLKDFEPKEGYYLAFSGGKDSCVIKELANMAGVKYDAHYHITTVDPPELTRFIKTYHPEVNRVVPEINMWDLIVKKWFPPTRRVRYCCEVLKEGGGKGRIVITGVRRYESVRRSKRNDLEIVDTNKKVKHELQDKLYKMNDNTSKRNFIESCQTLGKWIINPIIEWTDEDVWEFIKGRSIPYCELYDQGYDRLGCIACPLQSVEGMERDLKRYPTFKKNYINAFERMLERRREHGKKCEWKTGEDVLNWWLYGNKEDEVLGDLYEVDDD